MNQFTSKIITASAGTGKTYRLALEYIRVILGFYGKNQDFRPLAAAFAVVPIVIMLVYLAIAKRMGAFDAI